MDTTKRHSGRNTIIVVIGPEDGWKQFQNGFAGQTRRSTDTMLYVGSVRYLWVTKVDQLKGMTIDHYFQVGPRKQFTLEMVEATTEALRLYEDRRPSRVREFS